MKLHFRTIGEGKPLLILHGVFGSSDNWQTLGKVFGEHFKVYLVDLRNHGNSPHSDVFDYNVMAQDIVELMDDESMEAANILGHSMGGKVTMRLATQFRDRFTKPIIVDIAPKYYPPHHQQIFDGFRAVDLAAIQSRKEADERLSTVITNFGVRQFILKNLKRDKEGKFAWKLNVDAIERSVVQVGQGLEAKVHYPDETLFIAGGNSDYIQPADHPLIMELFPKALIETIEGAGHWVHAEKPNELSKSVLEFIV